MIDKIFSIDNLFIVFEKKVPFICNFKKYR